MKKVALLFIPIIMILGFAFSGCTSGEGNNSSGTTVSLEEIPAYSGEPYVVINKNRPEFSEADHTTDSFESYSELDELGRCGTAYANIGTDLMPTQKRGSIGQVKPSGWKTVKYSTVDGKYLYNRCHLIGHQLTAEDANEKNLITGTRSMNVDGMLPFENMVADYIKETDHHVLYRVTPIFEGENLVASGVQMEAESVEDQGDGINFNVYIYNVQPGITIDYKTGESHLSQNKESSTSIEQTASYVLNTNTKKFHKSSCGSVTDMNDSNKKTYKGSRQTLLQQGYNPCGNCKP